MVTNLEYPNDLLLMEPRYTNLGPRDASEIGSGCTKIKLGLQSKRTKRVGKVSKAFFKVQIGQLFKYKCQSSTS